MNKNELGTVADNLKLKLSEEFVLKLATEYDEQLKKIKALQTIDTTNVEPMVFVDETETLFMREDVAGQTLSVETIISNAPVSQGNFVSIKKVVK